MSIENGAFKLSHSSGVLCKEAALDINTLRWVSEPKLTGK